MLMQLAGRWTVSVSSAIADGSEIGYFLWALRSLPPPHSRILTHSEGIAL
jgi:hypothetical protein